MTPQGANSDIVRYYYVEHSNFRFFQTSENVALSKLKKPEELQNGYDT